MQPEPSIVEWDPRYGDAFGRLNREWLDKYFRVEEVDEPVLDDPSTHIIAQGGVILYLLDAGEAVGTVALKHQGDSIYELTKMAVTEAAQGRGFGRRLLSAAIDRFREIDGKRLYLESNSSLATALALYESAGFRHEARPEPSDYERADVFMVWSNTPENA